MLRRLNFFIVGLLGASLISAVTVPLLAWFYSADSIGRFSFFLLTVTFATQVGTLGLEQGYVREYHSSLNKGHLLFQTLAPSLLLIGLASVALVTFSLLDEIALFVISKHDMYLGMLIFFAYSLAIFHRFATVSYRVQSLGRKFCFVLVSVKLVFLVFAYAGYLFEFEESISLYSSYFLSMLIPLAWLGGRALLRIASTKSFTFFPRGLECLINWQLIRYSFPLLLGALAFWGVKFSGHIGLRASGSFEELAFYSVGVSIAAGLGIFSSIFNTMWFPFLFKAEANGEYKEAFSAGLELTVGLLFVGVGATALMADLVVKFLPEIFYDVRYFLPLLVLSPLLYTLSEVTGSGIALSKQTKYGLYSGVLGSVIALSASFYLTARFGAVGGAFAYSLGHFVFFISRTEFGRRLWESDGALLAYLPISFCVIYSVFFSLPSAHDFWLLKFLGGLILILGVPLLLKSFRKFMAVRDRLGRKGSQSQSIIQG